MNSPALLLESLSSGLDCSLKREIHSSELTVFYILFSRTFIIIGLFFYYLFDYLYLTRNSFFYVVEAFFSNPGWILIIN